MRRLVSLFLVFFSTLALSAQTMDAQTVYSEFQQQFHILKSANPNSEEYQMASQKMLQLHSMLQYHAATFSQMGNDGDALVFAKAYVDMALMPEFEEVNLEKSSYYSTMVYYVASNYYNRKDYAMAEYYLDLYIKCGEQRNRKNVFLFLAQTQSKLGHLEKKLNTLTMALYEYPTDQNLLALSINVSLENGWYEDAVKYINLALQALPGDVRLLSLKGQCYEGLGQYEQAVEIYGVLASQQKTLSIYKHYALNLFNCAVSLNTIDAERSKNYFQRAIPILRQVVANDPTSVPYTNALALSYLYTDQYDELKATNDRLIAMGAPEVGSSQSGQNISMLSSDLQKPAAPRPAIAAIDAPATPQQTTPASQSAPEQKPKSKTGIDFLEYAQNYVEKEINQWQQKDPFETIEEYTNRVTEDTRNAKVEVLMKEAKLAYLEKYQRNVRRSDFDLKPYDAENGVFLISSKYGDIVLPVARENNQARQFASDWMSVRIENTVLDIAGEELVVRSMDFITPQGRIYHYSDQNEARYSQADIKLQFNDIDYAGIGGSSNAGRQKVNIQKQQVVVGESDIDVGIPETKTVRNKTFAFVIGNENYQAVVGVPYALNDARSMKTYFNKALGIPKDNIRLYEDATFGKILACVRDIKSIASAYNGDVDIIFYYAGHGIPDEESKSAFLLPVDADGTQTESCYSIGRLYTELGQLGANSVLVLMDACFSGSQRGNGMVTLARSVALKAKADAPQGKMVTFSAATGEETAYPYDEKQHGMFSYFIMKHLQETKGKTTLGNLVDYVQTQVKQQSVVKNHKSQTPTVSASAEAADWRRWR